MTLTYPQDFAMTKSTAVPGAKEEHSSGPSKGPEVADKSGRGQQDPSAKHLLLHSSFLLRPLLHVSWTLASLKQEEGASTLS